MGKEDARLSCAEASDRYDGCAYVIYYAPTGSPAFGGSSNVAMRCAGNTTVAGLSSTPLGPRVDDPAAPDEGRCLTDRDGRPVTCAGCDGTGIARCDVWDEPTGQWARLNITGQTFGGCVFLQSSPTRPLAQGPCAYVPTSQAGLECAWAEVFYDDTPYETEASVCAEATDAEMSPCVVASTQLMPGRSEERLTRHEDEKRVACTDFT